MILFTILTLVLLILAVFTIIAMLFGGSVFLLIFGDALVCLALIFMIVKRTINKRKKR